MNIGDLFLQLLADGSKLTPSVVKEAEKAGDAGAKTLGQRLSTGLRTQGTKAFGVAAAGAFAIATKGALELENVQADIQAQTGMLAEDAKRTASVVNRVAGENRASLESVSRIAIGVHNDLGLVGDAADAMIAKIATFARVTKQDGAGVVTALDDITDAWQLTADEQATVLDKLLVSQQRYGGSISENAAALSSLAPQLQALNASYDEGIGLLNLLQDSGLDASKVMGALNFAVKKLKPGEDLNDLIAQVAAIEDPTKRAQKAIELFGAKGGTALANALRPGVDSLEDFAITAEESTGAVAEAAEVLDSTFSGRIQKAISVATASLREFGAAFGPALTGAASIAALLSATGLGGALSKGIAGAWGVVANSSLVSGAVKFASGKAATLYLATLIASDRVAALAAGLGSQLAAAISRVPGGAAVVNATTAAGTKIGTMLGVTAGAAMTVALAAAAVVAVKFVADQQQAQIDAQGEALLAQAKEFAQKASDTDLAGSIEGVTEQLNQLPGNAYDSRNKVIAILNELIAEQNRRAAVGGEATSEGFATGLHENSAVAPALDAAIVKPTELAGRQAAEAARESGEAIPDSIAEGALANRNAVGDAMNTLTNLMQGLLKRGERIARDIGILTSKQLAEGLTDERDAVRTEAERVYLQAANELEKLIAKGGRVGKKGMEAIRQGLNSENPKVRARFQKLVDDQGIILDKLGPKAYKAGANAGEQFGEGAQDALNSATVSVNFAVVEGKKRHRALGGPVEASTPYFVNEDTARSELFVPSTSGHILTHSAAVRALQSAAGGGGGNSTVINMPVSGALPVSTISDISGEMQRIDDSGILPEPRIAPLYRRRLAAGPGARR